MSRQWRPLPDGLSEDERELVELLRQMRDTSGLTLVQLSARTHHSKSSWQRWLNGERPVTEQALRSLAEVSGTPVEPALALLARICESGPAPEAADAAASYETAEPATAAEPEAVTAGGRKRGLLWGGLALAAAAVAAAVLSFGPLRPGSARPKARATSPAATQPAVQAAVQSAVPAMSCVASGCASQDPKSYGCAPDAVTLTTVNVSKRTVYLRYSPHCRAAWVKLTDATVGDKVTISDGTRASQGGEVHWGYDAYSMMLDASGHDMQLRVCGQIPDGNGCSPVITDPEQVARGLQTASPTPSGGSTGTPQ